MRLKTIDHPRRIDRDRYIHEIERVVSRLSATGFVQSIYQVGGITHPGISDIDIVVIIDGEATSNFDPRAHLSPEGRYLFTHRLFAVPRTLIEEYSRFTIFHNYRCLWGDNFGLDRTSANGIELQQLTRQVALEFLASNYIDIMIQLKYRIVKLRVLLQHIKGLRFDLAFLNITDGDMLHLLNDCAEHINSWFADQNGARYWIHVIGDIAAKLEMLLMDVLLDGPIASPRNKPFLFARNILIQPDQSLGYSHSGIVLPELLACLGRKYFNFQHRLNRFIFSIPMQSTTDESYLVERFTFCARLKRHIRKHVPHFAAPIPPLFHNVL